MSVALLFPGQGSQTPDMLDRLPDHPAVRQTLEEMSAELGYDVRTLDSPEALRSTVPVQLALLTAGVAAARALEAEGIIPEAVAGLSVGAFGAAVHAQVLSLADAVQLVKQRAELMEQHSPEGYGLTAIVGLKEDQVIALVSEANTPDDPVYVGNVNSADQIIITGSERPAESLGRRVTSRRPQGGTFGCSRAFSLSTPPTRRSRADANPSNPHLAPTAHGVYRQRKSESST